MTAVAVALGFVLLAPPSSVDLLFSKGDTSARVRVMVSSDGQSPEVVWRAFLDRWFAHFDRDADGLLSKEEAGRVPSLPASGGEVKPDFARMDANADGKVTPVEFRECYRAAGFAPVAGVVMPPSMRAIEVAEALFAALDRDGDGTLSAKELKAAPDLLRRFDENEDDELSEVELFAGWSGKVAEAKSMIRVVPSEGTPDTVIAFRTGFPVDVPGGRLLVPILAVDPSRARPLTAGELVAEQFAAVGGKADRPVLKSAVESVRTARAVAAVFDVADRDGDGKLTPAELATFTDLVEAGARCQMVLEVQDGGKSLFDLLNRDGTTLTREELEQATALAPMTRADVSVTYRLAFRRRPIAASFAGMPLVNLTANEKPVEKELLKAGPKWFRAMDRNGDGVVTREEFVGRAERFALLDTNGDGRITSAEADHPPK